MSTQAEISMIHVVKNGGTIPSKYLDLLTLEFSLHAQYLKFFSLKLAFVGL